ncbi:MAG: Na+/H+ antiporter subunit E [Pseudomonadales bacterium]
MLIAALLAAVWWVLTGGEPTSWLIGVPLVIGASLSGLVLGKIPYAHLSLGGTVRFVLFFLWGSLRGGITTAVLVLTRVRTVEPMMIEYRSTLLSGTRLSVFAGVIGLLPGTLTAELENDLLQIHVLDARGPVLSDVQELERRVAAMLIAKEQASR